MAPSVVGCDAPTVRVRRSRSRRRQPQSRPYFSAGGRHTIESPASIMRRFGLSISQTRQTTAPVAGPLLERDAELATLAAMVAAARAGEGQLVAIEGSAGIGKTRLLAEARAAAAEAGLDVLAARAGELEREFAFGVVRQLFEPLLATSGAGAGRASCRCRRARGAAVRPNTAALGGRCVRRLVVFDAARAVLAHLWGAKTLFTARDHPDLRAEPSADAPHG